jgi:general secretion pathway protein C
VLAVAALAWEAGRITWLVVPTGSPGDELASASRGFSQADQASQAERAEVDLEPVIARRLFGQPTELGSSKPEKVKEAPETKLDLKLQGVYFSSVDEHSIAIIKPGDKERQLYRVGDTVEGQARISSIERERVVLARGGSREVLPLETEKLDTVDASTTARTVDNDHRERLANYRDLVQQNPQQLRQLMKPSPVRDESGNLKGYRIEPGQSSDLFDVTDLEPGDVVTAIGDTKLDSDQAAMKAMQELGSSNSLEITVDRNGSQRRVRLNIGNQQ